MSIKDGGPAFPHVTNYNFLVEPGASLRDYFAAAALTRMLTGGGWVLADENDKNRLVQRRSMLADAMLAERERRQREETKP